MRNLTYIPNTKRWFSLTNYEGEKWAIVPKTDEKLLVSSIGRVKSLQRIVAYKQANFIGHRIRPERILCCHDNGHGYLNITFCGKKYYIHRLVASAFVDNKDNLPEVDHINTLRYDNRVENLRWTTRRGNMANELSQKAHDVASFNHQRPIVQLTSSGKFIREWSGLTAASKGLGYSVGSISAALTRPDTKTVGKFVFVYKDKYDPSLNYGVIYTRATHDNKFAVSETGFVLMKEGDIAKYFSTAKELAKYLGIHQSRLKDTYRRKMLGEPVGTRKSFPWLSVICKVKDLSEEHRKDLLQKIEELNQ